MCTGPALLTWRVRPPSRRRFRDWRRSRWPRAGCPLLRIAYCHHGTPERLAPDFVLNRLGGRRRPGDQPRGRPPHPRTGRWSRDVGARALGRYAATANGGWRQLPRGQPVLISARWAATACAACRSRLVWPCRSAGWCGVGVAHRVLHVAQGDTGDQPGHADRPGGTPGGVVAGGPRDRDGQRDVGVLWHPCRSRAGSRTPDS